MPDDAVLGLESAMDSSTYESLQPEADRPMSSLERALEGLKGGPASAKAPPPPEIIMPTMQAMAAKIVGKDRNFAGGGMARDAVSQLMAILPALKMQQRQTSMPMPNPGMAPQQGNQPVGMYTGGAAGDGVSDSIDAKLSAGEYVIPADVVAGLGKGSSEAGAKYLEQMISDVRKWFGEHIQQMPPPK